MDKFGQIKTHRLFVVVDTRTQAVWIQYLASQHATTSPYHGSDLPQIRPGSIFQIWSNMMYSLLRSQFLKLVYLDDVMMLYSNKHRRLVLANCGALVPESWSAQTPTCPDPFWRLQLLSNRGAWITTHQTLRDRNMHQGKGKGTCVHMYRLSKGHVAVSERHGKAKVANNIHA